MPRSANPRTTRRATILRFIAEHHSEDVGLAELGRELHLSPNRASTATRSLCGEGFATLLRKARLATAMDLLHLTDLPVTEVALRSGFNDISAFFRSFRVSQGCSPQTWRRKRRSFDTGSEA